MIEYAMSNHSTAHGQDDGHGAPSKDTKQLVLVTLLSIVTPLVIIIGLVHSFTSSGQISDASVNAEMGVTQRIQKVGKVEIGVAKHETRTGEEVFKAQCTNCHTAGVVGAPKFGDAAAWAPRIKTGFDALLNSALKGKNAMGPQGGGAFDDFEIARAVVYMANAGGAKFPEPKAPAAPK